MSASTDDLEAATRLGHEVVRRLRRPGPPVGKLRPAPVGSLASAVVRFAAATARPVTFRRVLGGPDGLGRGLPYILAALELGRVNIAARACGVARAAFDAAISYAQQRETFGVPIARHQAIQFKLADMATKLEASRLMVKSAAEKFERGERADVEAGMAKLFCSETAFELATEAMRIHGGYGYTKEFPVERYYRDAPLMIIGEGTNEIQRIVIARGLLARWSATHPS
jgi:alkylation response protein AidB-like acyl-CoA dehydrogenase